jgi:hypothetical protein
MVTQSQNNHTYYNICSSCRCAKLNTMSIQPATKWQHVLNSILDGAERKAYRHAHLTHCLRGLNTHCLRVSIHTEQRRRMGLMVVPSELSRVVEQQ